MSVSAASVVSCGFAKVKGLAIYFIDLAQKNLGRPDCALQPATESAVNRTAERNKCVWFMEKNLFGCQSLA